MLFHLVTMVFVCEVMANRLGIDTVLCKEKMQGEDIRLFSIEKRGRGLKGPVSRLIKNQFDERPFFSFS